jgi:hypothetical protein
MKKDFIKSKKVFIKKRKSKKVFIKKEKKEK